jgi:hypothetical protein
MSVNGDYSADTGRKIAALALDVGKRRAAAADMSAEGRKSVLEDLKF